MRIGWALLFLGLFLSSASSAAAQTLQAGDTLDISVWQDPKLDRRVIVSPAGTIAMPLAGHIKASGLTPSVLEGIIRKRLQANYNGPLDVTVTFAGRKEQEETKPRIFVTGEVLRPGPYVVLRTTSLMQAISLAGGFGPFAAKGRIQVHRKVAGVETTFVFNYNAYEAGTNMSGDIDLKSGDVIVVPERGLFE